MPKTTASKSTKTQLKSATPGKTTAKTKQVTKTPAAPAPWIYSEAVKEHFLAPRNFLMGDESQFPYDAKGMVGNPVCGDQMLMFLQIDAATDTITDLRWKTYGCASAIASTSALSELAKGKTLDAALAITATDIAEYLGGLPKHKFHCSVLGHEALAAAITNYRALNKS